MDESFLSVAIPHCDIIVTERFWMDLAKRIVSSKHLVRSYWLI